jgi:hypothetical protein
MAAIRIQPCKQENSHAIVLCHFAPMARSFFGAIGLVTALVASHCTNGVTPVAALKLTQHATDYGWRLLGCVDCFKWPPIRTAFLCPALLHPCMLTRLAAKAELCYAALHSLRDKHANSRNIKILS